MRIISNQNRVKQRNLSIKGTFLLLMSFLFMGSLFSQEITVTGTIVDNFGAPLPAVNVIIKGTNTGAITDIDGKFTLTVPNKSTVLSTNYIGYINHEIVVGEQTSINVQLEPDISELSEVVVVGYGTSRKSDLTGSISNVDNRDFNKGISLSPEQLIQGKVAGAQILKNSGAPDAEMTVRIRGTSSVRSGNQPLFVVDGIPLDGRNTQPGVFTNLGSSPGANPLNFINSNDIESINVLKDASSTAIYGSRGANGVVIITTKKGKSGVPRIDFNESVGISSLLRSPERMDATQYRQMLSNRELVGFDGGTSNNALKEITHNALAQNYNFAISGGNEKGNYRISLGYADQQGIIRGSDFKKYIGNFSGRYSFLNDDRLHIEINLNSSNIITSGVPISTNANLYGSLIGNALEWNPTVPLKDTGNFVQQSYSHDTINVPGVGTNPLALIEYYNDKSDVSNNLVNISPSFRIIDGLEYKFTLGINRSKGNRTTDISGKLYLSGITDQGYANVGYSLITTTTIDHIINYKKEIGTNFYLDAVAGYEYLNYESSSNNISAGGFSDFDVLGSQILQNPADGDISVSSYTDPTNSLQSYFSRVNLNFSTKYLITATMRADGSTKFGTNNKYGYFPSVAGAWILSEENFIPKAFSNLKLRASYGKTGNQEFPAGSAQSRYAFGQQSLSLVNVANSDLKWESTVTYNYGIDFGFIKDRLSGTVEYYNKTTSDLLFQLPTVQPAPSANYWANLPAKILNKGIELSLKGILIDKNKLYWDVSAYASFMKNELTNYTGAIILTGNVNGNGLASGIPCQQLANNYPLFVFNMLRFNGLDSTGRAIYSDNKEYVGDPNPKVLLGINSTLTYGRFSFDVSLNGAFGQKVYNNTSMVNLAPVNLNIGRNSTPEIGLGNESLTNTNVVSTRFLEKGNYLRLSNVNLNYNLGSFSYFKNFSISVTGQNLLLFTKYKGFDPEVNTDKSVNGVPSFGIDYGSYPSARTIMMGIITNF
jgi:TonB-dependent starch-binding outer membrane protein SusC